MEISDYTHAPQEVNLIIFSVFNYSVSIQDTAFLY